MGMMMGLHLLLFLLICGFGCSALPPAFFTSSHSDESSWNQDSDDLKLIYDLSRSSRHADGLFTSGYSRLLSQLTAKDYLQSLVAKRVSSSDQIENQFPVKRHSDAIFTNNYSRFRKQMAARKYLNLLLGGKRSVEDPGLMEVSFSKDATSSQSTEDSRLHDVISQLTLGP